MSVEDYIEKDLPFYHITPLKNKESILTNGLRYGLQKIGICVVRSGDYRVIDFITENQLSFMNEESSYCVFKIIPSKFNIQAGEVKPDTTIYEETNALHNYIKRSKIDVDESDIYIEERIIKNIDCKKILTELKEEGII